MTRSAADIGRGLAPARPARPIVAGERIHVVGAAGAGASAAAILAACAGARVTACDRSADSPYVPAVEAAGVTVWEGHDAAHVATGWEPTPSELGPRPANGAGPGATRARPGRRAIVDRLAVTKALTAIDPDHPELQAARALGIPIEPWQQVVADAAASRVCRLVAIAGTHGKSTSTGWMLQLLAGAGRDPSGFVGALLPAEGTAGPPSTARWGAGPEFVVEADEYAGNFDPYQPSLAVLLNAEWDHPDVFADQEAVLDAFEAWIRRADGAGEPPTLVVNCGDPGADRVAARLVDWPGRLVAVALAPDASAGTARAPAGQLPALRARLETSRRSALGTAHAVVGRIVERDADGTALEIVGLEGSGAPSGSARPAAGPAAVAARIALPGRHNAQNALCVAAAAASLGVPMPAVLAGLAAFRGVGRRLEFKGEPQGVAVLDDYAHHPTAIAETLAAVRQRYPGRRLWAAYEPLTYHRTAALLDRFADVLAGGADAVVIADIWAGRDPDTSIASAEALAAAVRARGPSPASAPGSVEQTADWLASRVRPGDVVLVMGGGRSYRIAARLVELLGGPSATPMPPGDADR
ncbi:MAG: UDP-N-acetylmuramate--L-alanine ligase [Candidatus Limnocylindrales bacterium]